MKSIDALELDGKAVFMRVDLNVPMKDGVITSDARVRAALPSVRHALNGGARLMLASHLGRPKGNRVPEMSLEPVAMRLSELLDQDVMFAEDCIGDGVSGLLREMGPGSVAVLENLRYHASEEKNDAEFSKRLAAPFNVYINDAFGASHRAHASIVGMVPHVKEAAAGFLLGKEVEAISKLINGAEKPFVAVVGGAKVSDKLGVLQSLIGKVDTLCIGGAMAYTFLAALGQSVGDSRVEKDKISVAKEVLQRARNRGVTLMLPVDHVTGAEFDENTTATVVAKGAVIADGTMGLDIGPESRAAYAQAVMSASTVFWNGPMGVFEWGAFSRGTMAVAEAVAETGAYTVVGGGDSVAAIEKAKIADRVSHVSTGGGASLELIELGTLPGLDALKR
ncbi:MAG: phosphoglycerate kinase [Myxococcota bacterium]